MTHPTGNRLRRLSIGSPASVYLAHCRTKTGLPEEQFLIIGSTNTFRFDARTALTNIVDRYDIEPILSRSCSPEEAAQLERRLHEVLEQVGECPQQDFDGEDRCYQCAFDHEVFVAWKRCVGLPAAYRAPTVYLAHFRARSQQPGRAHHFLKIGFTMTGSLDGRFFNERYPDAADRFEITPIAEVRFKASEADLAFAVERGLHQRFEFEPSLQKFVDVSAHDFKGEGECYHCCHEVYVEWNAWMRPYGWSPGK